MVSIITFLLTIGVIFSPNESTPELEQHYQEEYEQYENIISNDIDGW